MVPSPGKEQVEALLLGVQDLLYRPLPFSLSHSPFHGDIFTVLAILAVYTYYRPHPTASIGGPLCLQDNQNALR